MDNSFHTSFIPKKPVVSSNRNFQTNRSFNIIGFIATLVVLFVILSAVGIYFYKDYLNKQLLAKKNSLTITRDSLEEKTLLELQSFNKRLDSSKKIVAGHYVISPFFELLHSVTLPQVQFSDFTAVMSNDGKGLAVSMNGLAKDYRTVAIQADVFNGEEAKVFKDVSFTNFKLSDEKNNKGFVSFNVSFFVDPSFLSFENNILKYKNTEIEKDVMQEQSLEVIDEKNTSVENTTEKTAEKPATNKKEVNTLPANTNNQ